MIKKQHIQRFHCKKCFFAAGIDDACDASLTFLTWFHRLFYGEPPWESENHNKTRAL